MIYALGSAASVCRALVIKCLPKYAPIPARMAYPIAVLIGEPDINR